MLFLTLSIFCPVLRTGIKLSGSQVRRILSRKSGATLRRRTANRVPRTKRKFVYLWAKYSLKDKQNPEKRKIFKEKLSEYLRISKENPERLQVWFWDGAFKVANLRRHTAPHESGCPFKSYKKKNMGKKRLQKKSDRATKERKSKSYGRITLSR